MGFFMRLHGGCVGLDAWVRMGCMGLHGAGMGLHGVVCGPMWPWGCIGRAQVNALTQVNTHPFLGSFPCLPQTRWMCMSRPRATFSLWTSARLLRTGKRPSFLASWPQMVVITVWHKDSRHDRSLQLGARRAGPVSLSPGASLSPVLQVAAHSKQRGAPGRGHAGG